MGFFTINRKFLPIKFHYGLFNAGTSTVQTTMPVYAKTLRFSSFIVGTIYTILPLLGLIIKPFFGAVADKYKKHRTVLMAWEVIVLSAYFAVQFIPTPDLPVSNFEVFHVKALSLCSGANSTPHFLAETDHCSWTSDMTQEHCSLWNLTSSCSRYNPYDHTEEVSCISIPVSAGMNFSSQDWMKSCVTRKNNQLFKDADDDGEDDTEEKDNTLGVAETYATWQFWIFLCLLIGTWGGTSVITTISDTVCIEICGSPKLYGKQRMWGSIAWGVLAAVSGFVIDSISTEGEEKNYTPAFYFMLVPLLIDVVFSYFLDINLPEESESISKDVWKVIFKPRVIVFMFWCAMVGCSFGLIWNFQFWLLEELADDIGEESTSVIKTIEGLVVFMQCVIGEAPSFFIGGWIVNKVGYQHSLSLVLLAIGVRFSLYSLISNPWYSLPIEILQNNYGLFFCTMTSFAKAAAPPGTEATIQSILCAICEGVGVALGSFLAGLFFDSYGGSICFRIFGLSFLAMAIINEVLEFLFRKFSRSLQETDST